MLDIYLDIFHNIYSVIFCFTALYYSLKILNFDLSNDDNASMIDINYKLLYDHSKNYFIISSIINILDESYLFLIHHMISLISLKYGLLKNNIKYKYWLSFNFLAEISTIFLSLDAILKNLDMIYNLDTKYYKINLILKYIFIFLYILIRICLIMPINLLIMYNHQNNYFDSSYLSFLIKLCLYFMTGLNIYWFVLLLKKIILKIK